MKMSSPQKHSPAKSQGAAPTPKRPPRRSHSVGSPALSNASGRLSTMIQEYRDLNLRSFVVSPMVRKSILTDTTDIGEPKRQSWWKKLGENSINVMDVVEVNNAPEPNNILEELDIEVLSQEKKNYTLDLPENSDTESICSIVIPQRKLFTEKENVPQKKFVHPGQTRDTLGKLHNTSAATDEKISIGTRELFVSKPRLKPVFPAALLNMSPNKTTGDKTLTAAEPKGQVCKIFGKNPSTKRKKMFANFVVSESEDEIPEIQPKIFGFQKKPEVSRHPSLTPRQARNASSNSSVTTDIEFDDWKLLPSSTLVENQLEAIIIDGQTPKRARLSKLTEDKESDAGTNNTEASNKTKHSIKSTFSKDKSKTTTKEKSPHQATFTRNKSTLSQNEDTKLNKSQEKQHDSQILSPRNNKDSLQLSIITRSKSKIISTSLLEQKPNVTNSEDGENISMKMDSVEQNDDDGLNFTLEYDNDDVNDGDKEANQHNTNIKSNEVINKSLLSQHSQDKSEKINNYNIIENNKNDKEIENEEMQVDGVEINNPVNDNQEMKSQNNIVEKEISQNEKIQNLDADVEKEMQISQEDHKRENSKDNKGKNKQNEISPAGITSENQELEQSEEMELEGDEETELEGDEEVENDDEVNEEQENLEEDTEEGSQEGQNESQEAQITSEIEQNESQEAQIRSEIEQNESQEDQVESENEQDENENTQNETILEDEEEEEKLNKTESEEASEIEQQNSSQEEIDQDEQMDEEEEIDLAYDSASEEVAESDQDDNEEDESNQEIEASDNDSPKEHSQDENTDEIVTGTPNISHDTTGRNRNKYVSPEAVLQASRNQSMSFTTHRRNTSHQLNQTTKTTKPPRQTKSITKYFSVKPSLEPARESIDLLDGTKNSSAEGSGWDSHRTTRKTLRQTFGKDFTPRKSLRALVMEKAAKRQTVANDTASITAKFPVANSTKLPDDFSQRDDFDANVEPQESDHEISRRNRLTMLEMYLEKIKKQRIENEAKMEEKVRNSLKAPARTLNPLNVPKPMFPWRPITKPKKVKVKVKSSMPLEELPEEVQRDMKYKPPKRFRPSSAAWITKRLYKYLESKLEPKYDYKARVRSEKFVETLYNFTKEVQRRDGVASMDAVAVLKHEMARLDIVKTHFDFHHFFHEFMPREIRIKVIPDVVNKIPEPRGGVFADIL